MVFDDAKAKEYLQKSHDAEGKLNTLVSRLSVVSRNFSKIMTFVEQEERSENVIKTPATDNTPAVFEYKKIPAVLSTPMNKDTYKKYTDSERSIILTAAILEAKSIFTETNKLS